MTSRFMFARVLPLARRPVISVRPALPRTTPLQRYNSLHNLPAVRPISFARSLPKLVSKFATLGAAAGGATVAGLVYIQNQATAAGNYISEILGTAKDGAQSIAGDVFEEATDAVGRIKKGWAATKDGVEVPVWVRDLFEKKSEDSGKGDGGAGASGGSGPGGEPPKKSSVGAAAAGGAAALSLSDSGDDGEPERIARDEQMMLLTRKMIQIRSLLQTIGQSDTLSLPSIVVIGSQSSGKSSVLEAIVGHEFLPKGNNMVTRRPIELTLVNTPDSQAEYAEFPAMGLGKVTDFAHVQKTLTDLNLAVPAEQCVSDDPIQLRICSPNVPDLSLIDLPGYIQVTGLDQPPELKEKIALLCEKYIKAPNVILAISAADVDLANSTALRASRRVDPRGERTIGVITKMDLVDPERGLGMLLDRKYPLRLGYVGVVCKLPSSAASKFFNRGSNNISNAVVKHEKTYFSAHSEYSPDAHVSVGTPILKKKLMQVLEQTMASSLRTTSDAIRLELAEATYEFKVQYNDRPLSAKTYLAESLDSFKHSFRGLSDSFGRDEVRALVKNQLDQQVLNILAQKYWNRPIEHLEPTTVEQEPLSDLPKADTEDPLWNLKLNVSTSSLTKLGIGRLATSVVASALQNQIDGLIAGSTFAAHPFAITAIKDASSSILKELSYDVSDELEICVKPYKYRIELTDSEWAQGRENIKNVLQQELKDCSNAVKAVEAEVGGRRKLRDVMAFIDRVRSGQVVLEGNGSGGAGGFSAALLAKGRDAVFLRDRADIIQMRLLAVKAKKCASKSNKLVCPEVFLDAVADKLTATADLFLDAELLSKFYYSFPRELDNRLGPSMSQAELEQFAREDPKIRQHIDLVRRKELLEHALKEMESLRQLEGRERGRGGRRDAVGADRSSSKGWGFF